MLTELGIICKDNNGFFMINAMIVDLRNVKMKSESNIVSATKNNIVISENSADI